MRSLTIFQIRCTTSHRPWTFATYLSYRALLMHSGRLCFYDLFVPMACLASEPTCASAPPDYVWKGGRKATSKLNPPSICLLFGWEQVLFVTFSSVSLESYGVECWPICLWEVMGARVGLAAKPSQSSRRNISHRRQNN